MQRFHVAFYVPSYLYRILNSILKFWDQNTKIRKILPLHISTMISLTLTTVTAWLGNPSHLAFLAARQQGHRDGDTQILLPS